MKPYEHRCGYAKCIETGIEINDYKCICDTGYIFEYVKYEGLFYLDLSLGTKN
jgi:hypothetical protein